MLLEKLEQKIKLSLMVSLCALTLSGIISISAIFKAGAILQDSQKMIYVLNGEVPLMATQTSADVNIEVEAKSHINLFHSFFFTLPPDDEYINYTLEKSMYLVDDSGLKQKNALQEKGFYAGILSQSANFSIMCDSISFDRELMNFKYYGTQRIERKTSVLRRSLVTEGNLMSVPRTVNNPHGLIITNYKTVVNKDLEYKTKSTF